MLQPYIALDLIIASQDGKLRTTFEKELTEEIDTPIRPEKTQCDQKIKERVSGSVKQHYKTAVMEPIQEVVKCAAASAAVQAKQPAGISNKPRDFNCFGSLLNQPRVKTFVPVLQ